MQVQALEEQRFKRKATALTNPEATRATVRVVVLVHELEAGYWPWRI